MFLSYDESIWEEMIGRDKVCEDLHHKSYFLLGLRKIESFEFHVRLSEDADQHVNPFPKELVFIEGNMANIFTTIPIKISTKPDFMENVYIGENSSLEDCHLYSLV